MEATLTHEQIYKHAGASTVVLVHKDPEGNIATYCTGVWVSKTQILTANHCMMGLAQHIAEEMQLDEDEEINPFSMPVHYSTETEVRGVGQEPGAMHLAKVKKLDLGHDLALLQALPEGLPAHEVAQIADETPVGEHLVMVGHPRGLLFTYVEGTIAAVRAELPGKFGPKGPFVQVNATIWFGNSGGGAFDSHGKLVGIASFMPKMPNMCMYIHRNSIVKFLEL